MYLMETRHLVLKAYFCLTEEFKMTCLVFCFCRILLGTLSSNTSRQKLSPRLTKHSSANWPVEGFHIRKGQVQRQ